MTETIQLRQDGEPSENRTAYESPDVEPRQAICAMYLANEVAQNLDSSHIEVDISEDADVEASLDRATSNYGVFETPGGAVTGMYVSHDTLSEITDSESTEEEPVTSIGLAFRQSDSDAFEEAEANGVDEDEVEGLVAGETDSDESDDTEEEVEIADEEVGLVEGDD